MKTQKIHIDAIRGHAKMSTDELQAYLHARRSGHVHQDKSKVISRKAKYKDSWQTTDSSVVCFYFKETINVTIHTTNMDCFSKF